jgi:hypothetical protein
MFTNATAAERAKKLIDSDVMMKLIAISTINQSINQSINT